MELYTPTSFLVGSSVGHLNTDKYSSQDFLMVDTIPNGPITTTRPFKVGGLEPSIPSQSQTVRSTVTNNQATSASATGGGLWAGNNSVSVTLSSSIVAGNSAGGGNPDLNVENATLMVTFSLIGDNAGTVLAEAQTADVNGNLIGSVGGGGVIDPQLGPLSENGGSTHTHLALPGSLAINAGDPSSAAGVGDVPEFDQRGPEYPRLVDLVMDIGAVESPTTVNPAWHNTANPLDVDGNGVPIPTPLDALTVINELNSRLFSSSTSGMLIFTHLPGNPFVDVNDDGFVSPVDALLVINELPSSGPQAALSSQAIFHEFESDGQANRLWLRQRPLEMKSVDRQIPWIDRWFMELGDADKEWR